MFKEKKEKPLSAKTYSRGRKENAFATELRMRLVEDIFTIDIMNGIFLS